MNQPRTSTIGTLYGPITTSIRAVTPIYRVGYAPSAWEWTPWEYATDGRFGGRWDDPDGVWRTVYCADTPLACYLEVLAFARPSPQLIAELNDIVVDTEDEQDYPTLPPRARPTIVVRGTNARPRHPDRKVRRARRPGQPRHPPDGVSAAGHPLRTG